jgi:methyl-accepting chemotaxis protein
VLTNINAGTQRCPVSCSTSVQQVPVQAWTRRTSGHGILCGGESCGQAAHPYVSEQSDMRDWKKLSVATRLYVAFGLTAIVMLAQLALSYFQQLNSDSTLSNVTRDEYAHLQQVHNLQVLSSRGGLRSIVLNRTSEAEILENFGVALKGEIAQIDKQLADIKTWATSAGQLAILKELDAADAAVGAAWGAIDAARAANDLAAVTRISGEKLEPSIKRYDEVVAKFVDNQMVELNAHVAESQAQQWQRYWLSAGLMTIIGLAVAGWLMLLVRYIRKSLTTAVGVAETVSIGDLSVVVESNGADEFASLMHSLGAMAGNLRRVVGQVRESTEQISDASAQIAQGNMDLSERTERQASHLQETASTMEQLANTVGQSAVSAGEANRLAHSASEVARRGGEVVGQVVDTMSEIEKSSSRISEIIAVIDGISFQTNILALNAAVEAARAGEQGRGFAVVAAEVRNLAQRSATAAKEIKTLIVDSAEKVRNGSSHVAAAGKTMVELVASVQQVSALISEISGASAEQRTGIEGVTKSVGQLDQATQQNAALVEQAAAAAGSMSEQTRELARAVSAFKLV